MQELEKKLKNLADEFRKVYEKLQIDAKMTKIAELEREVAEPEIWNNVSEATAKNQELAKLQDETEAWTLLSTQIQDMGELFGIADEDMKEEMLEQLEAMEGQFAELKKALRFQGAYDDKDAIVRITSGAGGTEAMDWAGTNVFEIF